MAEAGALGRLSWILPDPVSEAMPFVERKSDEAPLMSNFKKLEPERLIFPAIVLLSVVPSAKLRVAELLAFRLLVLAERAPAPLKRRVPAVASTAPVLVFVPESEVTPEPVWRIVPEPLMLLETTGVPLLPSSSAVLPPTVTLPLPSAPEAPDSVRVPALMVVPPV